MKPMLRVMGTIVGVINCNMRALAAVVQALLWSHISTQNAAGVTFCDSHQPSTVHMQSALLLKLSAPTGVLAQILLDELIIAHAATS
jgi:hypothetical protein